MKSRLTVEERFIAAISERPASASIGLAVSGGSDSMALLYLAARHLAGSAKLVVLCFDHAIDGENSAAEFAFVENAAKRLGLPFFGRRADRPVRASRGISLEMAARAARRAFFASAARELRLDAIATAHQRDDVAETLLLRLLRGAGAAGLSGLRPFSPPVPPLPAIVRPLLDCGREELRSWLRRRRIRWMDDIANSNEAIPRCRVRLSLIPEIARIMGKPQDEIVASLAQSAAILRDEDEFLDSLLPNPVGETRIPSAKPETRRRNPNPDSRRRNPKPDTRIPFTNSPPPPPPPRRPGPRWLLSAVGPNATGFDSVEALRNAHPGETVNLPGGAVVDIDADGIATVRRATTVAAPAVPLPIPGVVRWGSFSIATEIVSEVERRRETPNRWPSSCTLSLRAVRDAGGLSVRSRSVGETMAPFGLGGTKKLQDIFVDCRIPARLRGTYPVIAAPSRVAWLPGYRIDAAFAVAKGDKAVRITVEEVGHEE